ncbi:MAG: hypothetical protein ACK4OO_05605, partial [bacterium]
WIDTLFYIPHQVPESPHRISLVSREGEVVEFFEQPLPFASSQGIRNLTWDGRWIWGTCLNAEEIPTIVAFTRDGRLVTDMPVPFETLGRTMPIAYSPTRRNLFISDADAYVYEVTRDGEIVDEWEIRLPGEPFNPIGMTWNTYDGDDMPLYILETEGNPEDTVQLRLIKFSPQDGSFKLVGHLPSGVGNQGGWGLTIISTKDHPQLRIAYLEDR